MKLKLFYKRLLKHSYTAFKALMSFIQFIKKIPTAE